MKKLLAVNLQDPGKTSYINPKIAGLWMLGKCMSNYMYFAVQESDGDLPRLESERILLDSAKIEDIQSQVDKALGRLP
jgi:hypothetical protein